MKYTITNQPFARYIYAYLEKLRGKLPYLSQFVTYLAAQTHQSVIFVPSQGYSAQKTPERHQKIIGIVPVQIVQLEQSVLKGSRQAFALLAVHAAGFGQLLLEIGRAHV